jgi:hypothetical protein
MKVGEYIVSFVSLEIISGDDMIHVCPKAECQNG